MSIDRSIEIAMIEAAERSRIAKALGASRIHPPATVSDQEAEERMKTCRVCPMYREKAGIYELKGHGPNSCMHCGCPLIFKSKLKNWHCPEDKW